MDKPRLGLFKFSCCAGCEFQIIFFQEHLVETFEVVEVVYGKMVKSGGPAEGPFDLALIEGTITECWQVDELKRIRENSKVLVAMGSCAINGGVPAIKNLTNELALQKRVYEDTDVLHSIRASSLDHYVHVDYQLKGCPMGERDFLEMISSYLVGREPKLIEYSVCVECKARGNTCVLVAEGQPCMGPVTNGGCGALCPTVNRACYACWGPMAAANAPALARQFEAMGLPPDEIVRRFSEFGYVTMEFRKGTELLR